MFVGTQKRIINKNILRKLEAVKSDDRSLKTDSLHIDSILKFSFEKFLWSLEKVPLKNFCVASKSKGSNKQGNK